MSAQPANIDLILRTPDFGIYDNVLATRLNNKATRQGFDMDNLVMMDVKTLNSVFSEYKKKACTNGPRLLAIKIQKILALHRHVQVKFLSSQVVTASNILPILSKVEKDYIAISSIIGAKDKDAKSAVTPVIFNSPDKFILLPVYWEVIILSMKSVIDQSKLDCLLHSRRSYTPAKRATLAANSLEDSVADIEMNRSACTDNTARVYDALIPGIFGTLAE